MGGGKYLGLQGKIACGLQGFKGLGFSPRCEASIYFSSYPYYIFRPKV